MLTTKNKNEDGKWGRIVFHARFLAFLAVAATMAAALVGCGPPGSHALLKGKRLLDEGDYANAADEFKSATEVMTTNAQAWNYLGVAEQHAGQYEEAASAYQRALELDRDLTEAHYNLGTLWLDQNKPDEAASEFTAYTLRRVKAPEGWVKLGVAQLKLNNILQAEKSFSTALNLSPNNAEALNGLGLARMMRNRPEEAEKFFQAAVQNHPDYAPAVLNLATVEHQYMHNDRLALDEYRAYLALTPRPPHSDEVSAIVNSMVPTVAAANAQAQNTQRAPAQNPAYTQPPYAQPPQQQARTQTQPWSNRPKQQAGNYTPPREQTQTEVVPQETEVARQPNTSTYTPPRPVQEPDMFASVAENPPQNNSHNPIHWFRPQPTQDQVTVTPLPEENRIPAPAPKPYHYVHPAPPEFPHYLYLHPAKPAPGDRRAASAAFQQARQFEGQSRYTEALNSYRQAAQLDPAWFEAQYNCGVMAYRLRDFQFSLESYEMALAIQPDSAFARYNFALALRAAGYVPDAVAELRKMLASNPNDARAHLELGNIYAQQLYDIPRARQEYLEVLRLDPTNPQASNIQFWLNANPQ